VSQLGRVKLSTADPLFEYSCETTLSSDEVLFLQQKLQKSKNYLEFGSGFSTIEASKYVKKSIVSVETDRKYINFLQNKIKSSGVDSSKVILIHADIGENREWGYPADNESINKWPNYFNFLSEFNSSNKFSPDLALIDGRFRVASFANLYLGFPGLKIIFDDYYDRPQYHIVESILKPKIQSGRIALFKVPRIRIQNIILIATNIMLGNALNPE
jgi:hypothetical protein